jgi:hypothetical protein
LLNFQEIQSDRLRSVGSQFIAKTQAIQRPRYMTLETIAPLSDDPACRHSPADLRGQAGNRGDPPPIYTMPRDMTLARHSGASYVARERHPRLYSGTLNHLGKVALLIMHNIVA